MSVEVRVDGAAVDVLIGGWDRVWGWRSRVEVPLGRVRGVGVQDRSVARGDVRWRAWGLGVPWGPLVGYMRGGRARRQFWVVHRGGPVLVLDLVPEASFDRVVVGVPDAEVCAERIRAAVAQRGALS